jgi:hypothetical protein
MFSYALPLVMGAVRGAFLSSMSNFTEVRHRIKDLRELSKNESPVSCCKGDLLDLWFSLAIEVFPGTVVGTPKISQLRGFLDRMEATLSEIETSESKPQGSASESRIEALIDRIPVKLNGSKVKAERKDVKLSLLLFEIEDGEEKFSSDNQEIRYIGLKRLNLIIDQIIPTGWKSYSSGEEVNWVKLKDIISQLKGDPSFGGFTLEFWSSFTGLSLLSCFSE